MQKIYTLALLSVLFLFSAEAQNNIGIGTNTPDASAKLDISSTNMGLLIPRISIGNVATWGMASGAGTTGMLVYNTNAATTGGSGVGFYYWGGSWIKVVTGTTATLTNGKIWIGNASSLPAEQTMSGDVAITNAGVATVQDNSVDGTDIALGSDATGDIMYYNGTDWVRLASGTTGYVLQTTSGAAPAWVSSTKNDKAQNGLNIQTAAPNATATDPYVELGGSLIRATTITQDNNAFTILNNNASNTIVNLSSTGDFDVQDNGTSALFVRDDGTVGINNNAPTAKLHILVPAAANGNPATNGIYVYNSAGGASNDDDDAIITTRVNGANAGDPFFSMDIDGVTGWSIGVDNSDADKLKFSNAWNDPGTNARMTITTPGNIGIGTEAPAYKLSVNGTIEAIDFGAANSQNIRVGDDAYLSDVDLNHTIALESSSNSAVGALQLGSNTASYLYGSAGNIGVGTTTLNAKLDVAGILAMNDYAIRLRPGTDANHQIVFATTALNGTTVDGPSIQGCTGIEFKRNCTAATLGTWTGTALDVYTGQVYARNGIKSKRSYYYYQRYGYTTSGNGWDNSSNPSLGDWDFCAVGQFGMKNDASDVDEDDDVQCAVYPTYSGFSSGIGEQTNYTSTMTRAYTERPTWLMYFEAYADTNGVTCAANCINFE